MGVILWGHLMGNEIFTFILDFNFLVIIKKLLNDFYFYSYQQLGPKHSFPIYFLVVQGFPLTQ
jgi:hypothetical protein